MAMLKQLIQDSPFDQKTVFEAIRIKNHFAKHNFTLDDIAAAKADIIKAQHEEIQQAEHEEASVKPPPKPRPSKKKTEIVTKPYDGALRCPSCSGRLYKENVCGGCKEGLKGKKLRFICENYPKCNYEEAV